MHCIHAYTVPRCDVNTPQATLEAAAWRRRSPLLMLRGMCDKRRAVNKAAHWSRILKARATAAAAHDAPLATPVAATAAGPPAVAGVCTAAGCSNGSKARCVGGAGGGPGVATGGRRKRARRHE